MSTAPPLVTDTVGTWPWDAAKEHPAAWCAMSEEHAEYCLNVLPPIYFPGGFAVSEASRHDEKNRPVYQCVVRYHGKPYGKEATIGQATAEAAILRANLVSA